MPTDVRPINWPIILNFIHKKHNNPSDKRGHWLMIKRQIHTRASYELTRNSIRLIIILAVIPRFTFFSLSTTVCKLQWLIVLSSEILQIWTLRWRESTNYSTALQSCYLSFQYRDFWSDIERNSRNNSFVSFRVIWSLLKINEKFAAQSSKRSPFNRVTLF